MRRSIESLFLAGAVLLWSIAATSLSYALSPGDKEAVRVLSNEAAKDFEGGRLEAAREKFLRAYAIAKVPRLALHTGRTSERLGRLVEAYELFREAIALERNELWLKQAQEQAQAEARGELLRLQPRLAKLVIRLSGTTNCEVEVTLDDVAVPAALLGVKRYVDPGSRRIAGRCGTQKAEQQVNLAEGESKEVVLEFSSAPPLPVVAESAPASTSTPTRRASDQELRGMRDARAHPPRPGQIQRSAGWVGLAVGAAGVAVGSVAGAVVASKYGDLKAACPDRRCQSARSGEVESYDRWQTVSTLGFVLGGIGAAAGLTLLLTSPKPNPASDLAMWITPGSASLRGRF